MILPKPKLVAVPVPEWEEVGYGTVYVRKMSGQARFSFERENYELGKSATDDAARGMRILSSNFHARLLVRCLCDGEGKPLFTVEQAGELGEQDSDLIQRLYDVAAPLNGIGVEAEEEAKKK